LAIIGGGERHMELAGNFLSGGEVNVRYAGQKCAADSRSNVFRVDFPDPTSADHADAEGLCRHA